MRSAGCDTLYDMDRIEVMGLDGLFGKFFDILKIRSNLYRIMMADPPDLFIGIDVPDFNLSLEAKLKKRKIPTLHYVSPTVWAWRGYRIHKIRKAVNRMLALFPFEADYYRKNNIAVTCVGHPIADEIDQPDKQGAREKLGLDISVESKLIALLPGSRRSEVSRLAEVFVEVANNLLKTNPELKFILPFANKKVAGIFRETVGAIENLPITLLDGQSRLAMEASDVVLLASGTAALEAALLRKPHVVAYKVSALTYWLVQKLGHVTHYSMPNNLLETPLVPEFIQDSANQEDIAGALRLYIEDQQAVWKIEQKFEELHQTLKLDANTQACNAVLKMLGLLK